MQKVNKMNGLEDISVKTGGNTLSLKDIDVGEKVKVTALAGEGALRQHFLDMGIVPGVEITVVKYAPLGDPVELLLRNYKLTVRLADAEKISVVKLPAAASEERNENPDKKTEKVALSGDKSPFLQKKEHPRLGEKKPDVKKVSSDGKKLTFALVGNQNSGKTTLYNTLTGANRHVGNFPGVTVDRKDGAIKGYPDTVVTDLPGIYSMSPYSSEELISRDFVLKEKPSAIINIVDASNIERNLYLTLQLIEMDVPMVVALNMMDEVSANGGSVDINRMEELLGVPVVPISAAKNQGVDELISHAVSVAAYSTKPLHRDLCSESDNGGAVHRCLHGIRHLIADHAESAGLPLRFAVSKVVEGDELIISQLNLDVNEREMIEHIVLQMESERGLDASAAIADSRFAFIENLCREAVVKPRVSKERVRSEKIDRILTGRFTAIPVFILIMAAVFYLTFYLIGGNLQALFELGVDALTGVVDEALTKAGVNVFLHGLVVEGIFAGVGSVLSFLPIIVTLFFFLSLLEDSGYVARVAFFMDGMLRKIGLSGRSIVPMLIGFGCTVPAVMSTRTLPSERDRKMTILLTPFMSCTAKLPVYAFFVDAFFPKYKVLIMIGLYVLGIIVGILFALISKHTLFKGEAVPFVMELPDYRLPGFKNVSRLLWEKAKDFITRAFTVILIATIVIWLLGNFDFALNPVIDGEGSILAVIATGLSVIMIPLGLGDWRIGTSLISGVLAKESVVSTLGVLFGESVSSVLTLPSAAALLVFSLLYTPCIAALAAIRREMGFKWAAALVVWQCAIAWVFAFLTYLVFGGFAV